MFVSLVPLDVIAVAVAVAGVLLTSFIMCRLTMVFMPFKKHEQQKKN